MFIVRLYERPLIRSAITMLSVDLTHAANFLLQHMSLFPTDLSLTVYGLDASFKSFFVWKYMREKRRIMDTASLLAMRSRKRTMIHFVVEATWTTKQAILNVYMYVCMYVYLGPNFYACQVWLHAVTFHLCMQVAHMKDTVGRHDHVLKFLRVLT